MTLDLTRYPNKPGKRTVIRKSGAYVDVPISLYHSGVLCAGTSISSTGLRRVLESPAHFYADHPVLNPNPIEGDDNENRARVFGSACHTLAFEPHLFDGQFIVLDANAPRRPSGRQRRAKKQSESTLEAIAFWDDIEARGLSVLTATEGGEVEAMAETLSRDPLAKELFSGGMAEITLAVKVKRNDEDGTWGRCDDDDPEGVWLLARPDYLPYAPERQILDYKTTANAEPEAWTKHAFNLRLDMQASLQLWVCSLVLGETRPGVAHVIQETKAPHVIQSGRWDSEDLDAARADIFRALDRLHVGLAYNSWPPYGGDAFDIIKPRYLRKQELAA